MKISGVTIGISPLHILVAVFCLSLFTITGVGMGDYIIIGWGVLFAIVLIAIPAYNSYSVAKSYEKLLPEYEAQSKYYRIAGIHDAMLGKPVRIRGEVETIKGKLICRPSFTVNDGSCSIIAQHGAPIDLDIKEGDTVEIVGMVTKRFTFFGKMMIHLIGIKKTDKVESSEDSDKKRRREKKRSRDGNRDNTGNTEETAAETAEETPKDTSDDKSDDKS
ncbi:MAG: hypothetical protein II861_01350 [Methanomicrobium sp.]|nr:hypothetical protein [Methanomicrobium sp.]